MKGKTKIKGLIAFISITLQSQILFAQWQVGSAGGLDYGRTDPSQNIFGVGIGDFPNGTPPLSALHINTNSPFQSNIFWNAGEVFRTNAPDISTYWRMLRNGTEAGKIYSLDAATDGDGYHFYIASSYADPAGYFGDIRFVTPGYLPSFNDKRMRIVGSSGYVGIGDFSDFIPQNILHQHTGTNGTNGSSVSNYHQFTNDATGGISTDGFLIGIADEIAIIKQQEDFPILMYTNGTPRLWMHKRSINSIDQTAIGINVNNGSFVTNPKSILHLGTDYSYGANYFGWRTWMNVGTFCSQSSDFAFFGEMDRIGDTTISITGGQNDAVIAWGDNEATTPNEADNLRFIFSGLYTASPGNAGGWMGLEVGRFLPTGMFGIGNFTAPASGGGLGFDPVRRLEIYDEHLDPYLNTAAPQLRLTYQPNGSIAMGINTDFQTTFRGDLYIHPSADGTNRRVGINRDDPRTTLEINSNGNIATNPRSGLQFTDMTNASPRSATNGGVLSLDSSGEVIFVDDIGGGNISSSCGTLLTNYITKATASSSICTSGIYENASLNVGIGSTFLPNAKLEVNNYQPTTGVIDAIYVKSTDGTNYNQGIGALCITSTSAASSYNKGFIAVMDGAERCRGFECTITNNYAGGGQVNKAFGATVNGINSSNLGLELSVGDNTTNATSNYGVKLAVGNPSHSAPYTYGVRVSAWNGSIENYGVWAESRPTQNNTGISCGVYGFSGYNSITTDESYGLYGVASGGSVINYGLYASNYNTGTCSGIGCANAAAFFNGPICATQSSWVPSDSALKINVNDLLNANTILSQLHPKKYYYDTLKYHMNLSSGLQFGLIAQELALVLPQLTRAFANPEEKDSMGNVIHQQENFTGISYEPLITLLIAGYQEQQIQIDSLINAIAAGNQPKMANPNNIEVTLSNQNEIILNQNDPNPFAENTTINYFIPDNVNAAKLLFYDNSGTVLKTVDIKEKGQGSILIYGSNLSSGVYTYTLLADGKPIETKRMVKSK